jgi:hypothetical protein
MNTVNKKYSMLGFNKESGSVIEIEFNNIKNFSRESLKDMILVPQNDKREADSLQMSKITTNVGARDFFGKIANEFNTTLDELDNDLGELETMILGRTKHNGKTHKP